MVAGFNIRETCRLCGGNLRKVLQLPDTPLANEYPVAPIIDGQDVFPLFLAQCIDCDHVQLPVIVDADRLFRNYAYQSGTSPVFREHLAAFARDVQPKQGGLVVEIGSNDGTLLAEYRNLGFKVLGVDPARNLVDAANAGGIDTIPEFFGLAVARDILAKHGPADLIVANNVFAHADDLAGITQGIAELLAPDGLFAFEVGYLPDMIERGLYRLIYHEHVSYHHLQALRSFGTQFGLFLIDAHRVATQGGSMRGFYRKSMFHRASVRLIDMADAERKTSLDVSRMSERIARDKRRIRAKLDALRAAGKTVAGYGAPAQLTTTMYALGLGRQDIDFVVDDNSLKWGRFTPGQFVPILRPEALYAEKPDAVIIFSQNFAEDIKRRHARFDGEWVEI